METDKKIKLVKSSIQSLLISSTRSMNAISLQKDYYENFGENIPYKDFGYSSIISFLQSLSDVLKLCGNDSSSLIIPCVSQNSVHIEKMMQKQKKKVTGGCQPRPKAILEQKPAVGNNLKLDQSSTFIKNDKRKLKNTYNNYESNKIQVNEFTCQKQVQQHFPESDNIMFERSSSSKQSDKSNARIKRDFIKTMSEQDIKFTKPCKITLSNNEVLKNQLRNLIASYKNGIWCGQLPSLYKHKYNCELNISHTGYPSISQYCASIPDIFQIIRPDSGDFLLFDARFPVNEYEFESEQSPLFVSSTKLNERKEEALPALDFEWKIDTPKDMSDVVLSDTEIPRQWIDDVEDDVILIKVGQVYDPSVFWIILESNKCSKALTDLMDHLQCFYATQNMYYQIPKSCIREGLVCASLVLNEWHRGVIIHVVNDSYVKVFYFDYGSIEVISVSDLRYLANEFKHLPQQAIRASLLNIIPYRNDYWSEEACETFLQIVIDKSLYATSVEVNREMRILNMVLIDTNGENDVIINEYLCKNMLAAINSRTKEPKKSKFTKFNHSYIECGKFPALNEWKLLLSKGLSANNIFETCIRKISENPFYKFNVDDFRFISSESDKRAILSENSDVSFTEPISSSTTLENSLHNSDKSINKIHSDTAHEEKSSEQKSPSRHTPKVPPGFTSTANSDMWITFYQNFYNQLSQFSLAYNSNPYIFDSYFNNYSSYAMLLYPYLSQIYSQFNYQIPSVSTFPNVNYLINVPYNVLPKENNPPTYCEGLNNIQNINNINDNQLKSSFANVKSNSSPDLLNKLNNIDNSSQFEKKSNSNEVQFDNLKNSVDDEGCDKNLIKELLKSNANHVQSKEQICIDTDEKNLHKNKEKNKIETKTMQINENDQKKKSNVNKNNSLISHEVSTQTDINQYSFDSKNSLSSKDESLNSMSVNNSVVNSVKSQLSNLKSGSTQTNLTDFSPNSNKCTANNTNKKKNKKKTSTKYLLKTNSLDNIESLSSSSLSSKFPSDDQINNQMSMLSLNDCSKCNNKQSSDLNQKAVEINSNNISLNIKKTKRRKGKKINQCQQEILDQKKNEINSVVSEDLKKGKDKENRKLVAGNTKEKLKYSSIQIHEETAKKMPPYLLKTKINNCEVHLLKIQNQLCITANEILQFTKYDSIEKLFIIFKCQNLKCPLYLIDLKKFPELQNELKLYQIPGLLEEDKTINVINIKDVPYFLACIYSKNDRVLSDINNILKLESS